MFYQSELRFLCDTLKKCRVSVTFAPPQESIQKMMDDEFKALFGVDSEQQPSFENVFGPLAPYTIYKLTNPFQLCYIFFLLPNMPQDRLLIIGPYVAASVNSRQVLEIGEKYGVSPQKQKTLERYYGSIPIIEENSYFFALLDTFSEHIWVGSGGFSVVDLNRDVQFAVSPLNKTGGNEEREDMLANMKIMEKRYAYENELMQAVSHGQVQKADMIMSGVSSTAFEKRLSDSLRDLKNYSIIMNTLLRKAAENGGVHPLYLHSMSSSFATKIEQLVSTNEVQGLMMDMFRSYCRLVRKHSIKQYSSAVQKAMVFIDSDLSANLSLSALASVQDISPGYLSTIFKKETGKTITEYINERRIKLAMQLLSTTRLQIQTVALHCGIMDVQYFSKVFKKYTGKTPKEYRASVK